MMYCWSHAGGGLRDRRGGESRRGRRNEGREINHIEMRMRRKKGLIVAFDMEDVDSALSLAREMRNADGEFVIKIGRPLEMQAGVKIMAKIKEISGLPVIYDGKIADIPYISRRIAENAFDAGADAVIVHAFVGSDVLRAVKETGKGDVIAVVDMTHEGSNEFLRRVSSEMISAVLDVGVDGVVIPATDPQRLRHFASMIDNAYIISPGIKTQGASVGDAILNGADYEIVGRAIYAAENPKEAAETIYEEMIRRWRSGRNGRIGYRWITGGD